MRVGRVGLAGSGDHDHVVLPSEICKIKLELICFPSSTLNDPEMANMQKILCRSENYTHFKKCIEKERKAEAFGGSKIAS